MTGIRDQALGLRRTGRWIAGVAIMIATVCVLPHAAMASNICYSSTCTTGEVGPFMQGISSACGNLGTCSLDDIMAVFHNVGNWILGIIGAVVFLMYIYGGFMLMLGGAGADNVKKGKQALKISTMGLLIVFVAYAGVQTLYTVLTSGSFPSETIEYVVCGPGNINEGAECNLNSHCSADGRCLSICEETLGDSFFQCTDINGDDVNFDYGSCNPGLCPGPDNVQCCLNQGEKNLNDALQNAGS